MDTSMNTPMNTPMNILFILCDQERYMDRSSPEYRAFDAALKARKRLQDSGVTFTKHQINSEVTRTAGQRVHDRFCESLDTLLK